MKEGKLGIKNGLPLPGQDEPLHAYVTAPNPESVKNAVDRVCGSWLFIIELPEQTNTSALFNVWLLTFSANDLFLLTKFITQIKQIIKEGIAVPDAENDLRKQQLRELALLNGTLREGDALSWVVSDSFSILFLGKLNLLFQFQEA